ncbi:MAG: phosphopantetheine-binding protein [Bacteriovorax sp.]
MNDNYLQSTISVLQNFCPDLKTPITPETKIVEDLGLESIDFVDFIFELEKIVNLRIDIVQLSIALSKGTTKRFREVRVADIANYLKNIKG